MYTRDILGHYTIHGPTPEDGILAAAEDILRRKMERIGDPLTDTATVKTFLRVRLASKPHEEFHAVWLDVRHRVISMDMLSTGTIAGASVYPREIVRAALRHNAAAVIFAHNHPSDVAEPSQADREITSTLKRALDLIEVRVLDHFVVGATDCTSFAQRGLL